jgi:hypothetical protein
MHLTGETKAQFLDLLRSGHNLASASSQIGATLAEIERRRKRKPKFNEEIDAAIDDANMKLARVIDQKRARAVLSRMDRRYEARERARQQELAAAQRRTDRVVAKCNRLIAAVEMRPPTPQELVAELNRWKMEVPSSGASR